MLGQQRHGFVNRLGLMQIKRTHDGERVVVPRLASQGDPIAIMPLAPSERLWIPAGSPPILGTTTPLRETCSPFLTPRRDHAHQGTERALHRGRSRHPDGRAAAPLLDAVRHREATPGPSHAAGDACWASTWSPTATAPGSYGLIQEYCPHRNINLLWGIPEPEGLRCAYHGWLFNEKGKCLEQPAECPGLSTFKDRVQVTSYPVEELGGCSSPAWAPAEAAGASLGPLREGGRPRTSAGPILPCNWLQIMENSLDPVHVEWLHQYFTNYVLERIGADDPRPPVLAHRRRTSAGT